MRDENIYSYFMLSIGAILGVFSVIYFGFNNLFGISPQIKTFVLFSFSIMFFLTAFRISDNALKKIFYFLSPITYLTGLNFMRTEMGISQPLVLFSLIFSATAFLVIGRYMEEIGHYANNKYTVYVIVLLVMLTGLTAIYDIGSGDVSYITTFSNTTSIDEEGYHEIGYVIARNNYQFKKKYNPPAYSACIYPRGKRIRMNVKHQNEGFVKGNSVLQSSLFVEPPANDSLNGLADSLRVIENSTCSKNGSNEEMILVSTSSD